MKQYIAYCPINVPQDEALEAVKGYLKTEHVCVVSKRYGSDGYNVKVIPFRGTRANSYGYDLYLYQIEADELKYLDCGDFN